jgi:integrase/recombinase XerD
MRGRWPQNPYRNRLTQPPYSDYLETLRQRNYSTQTIDFVSQIFQKLAEFVETEGKNLRDLTADDIYRFKDWMEQRGRYSEATLYQYIMRLRIFFQWLMQTGQIFLNPYAQVALPKPATLLPKAPTEGDIRNLLAQPDISGRQGIRDRALLELAYSTAARRGELCRLSVTDIDLEKRIVRLYGKGRKERLVPMGKKAVVWLKHYLRCARPQLLRGCLTDRLWLGARCGKPLDVDAISAIFRLYAHKAGMKPVSPHAVRRACATHLMRNGASPVQIQTLLGHANLSTLKHYVRLTIHDLHKTHARSKPGR